MGADFVNLSISHASFVDNIASNVSGRYRTNEPKKNMQQ
jgi:hypothetical protein